MGFSRQEYCNGLPFPSPKGNDKGIWVEPWTFIVLKTMFQIHAFFQCFYPFSLYSSIRFPVLKHKEIILDGQSQWPCLPSVVCMVSDQKKKFTFVFSLLVSLLESPCNAGDPGLIIGWGRSTGEGIGYPAQYSWASLVAQMVKNPRAVQETWVQSPNPEDHLEKGVATHSSILGLENPTDRGAWDEKSWTWLSNFHFHFTSFLVMIEDNLLIEHRLCKSIAVKYVISSGRWRMINIPLMPTPQGQSGDPMTFFLQSGWPVLVWSV